MERRHQVFVSSTFSDLIEERAEIIQALLELDCFPAGMEMFPATNEDAWALIKKVIDDSDYYCLVLGGRYGSVGDSGLSFTEMEYDYAVSINKPIIAFLHREPGDIKSSRSESDPEKSKKLLEFRTKVEKNHHCKYWISAEDLGSKVSRSVVNIKRTHPSYGWVPGAYASDESTRMEIMTLRARVAELEANLSASEMERSNLQEDIACGEDTISVRIPYVDGSDESFVATEISWDKILKYIGPSLMNECSEDDITDKLRLCFLHELWEKNGNKDAIYDNVVVQYVFSDMVNVQMRALGYISPGVKRRTVSDKKSYWKLTPLGEKRLTQIMAIKKTPTGGQ